MATSTRSRKRELRRVSYLLSRSIRQIFEEDLSRKTTEVVWIKDNREVAEGIFVDMDAESREQDSKLTVFLPSRSLPLVLEGEQAWKFRETGIKEG